MATKRDAVLDAALAVLNRRPTATMAELAEEIGSSRATLHRHFASREALLLEIAARSIARWNATHDAAGIDEAGASGNPEQIETALRTLLQRSARDAGDYGAVLTDGFPTSAPEVMEPAQAALEREISFYAAAQAAGVLRDDIPPRWIADVTYGLMVAARDALRWGDVPARDIAELVETTLLKGVAR